MRFCKLRVVVAASLSLITFAPSSHATDLSNSTTGSVSDGSMSIPYRLFQPTGVAAGQKVPLILFLHGAGDTGTDNVSQTYWMNNLQQKTASGTDAAYVLAPQIPTGGWIASSTNSETEYEQLIMSSLKQAEQNPNIDTSRIYITGVSMGSFGTWDLLKYNPTTFAAAVPMSAGGVPATASTLKNIPIWAFHGSADQVESVQETRDMVAALQAVGGNIKYTEIAGGDHYIWPQVYADQSLYSWMFGQHLPGDVSDLSTTPGAVPAVPVPVPEPTLMGLIGLAGMAMFVRRPRVMA